MNIEIHPFRKLFLHVEILRCFNMFKSPFLRFKLHKIDIFWIFNCINRFDSFRFPIAIYVVSSFALTSSAFSIATLSVITPYRRATRKIFSKYIELLRFKSKENSTISNQQSSNSIELEPRIYSWKFNQFG